MFSPHYSHIAAENLAFRTVINITWWPLCHPQLS